MPFQLDDIRNFAGTDRMLFDPRSHGGALQSVNKWQRFKSYFGIGIARQQNSETLAAIHNAILNEPKFFAKNIQDKAIELLAKVRTDRAIRVADIQSIVTQLDSMSTDKTRRKAAEDLVGARIAARGQPIAVPPEAGAAYLALAKTEVVPRVEPQDGGGYGRIDYAAGLDAFDARIGQFFTHLGNGAGDAATVSKFLSDACAGKNIGQLAALGDAFRANFDESRALGAQYGDQARLDAVAALEAMKKPLAPTAAAPAPLRAIVEAGRAVRTPLLGTLSAQSSALDIHRALEEFATAVSRLPVVASFAGAAERDAVLALAAKSALNALPRPVQERLLAVLQSDAGKHVVAFCRDESANADAKALFDVAQTAGKHLKTVLGEPDAGEDIPLPQHPDPAQLSAAILTRYSFSAERFLSGNAADAYKGFIDRLVQANPDDPLAAFRSRMSELATASTVVEIAGELNQCLDIVRDDAGKIVSATFHPDRCPSFAADVFRTMDVRFSDGSAIDTSTSLEDARTKLLRFVTGDGSATWEPEAPGRGEDPQVLQAKIKALILMSLLNQASFGIALDATLESVAGNRQNMAGLPQLIHNPGKVRSEYHTLRKDANGDISVGFHSRWFVSMLYSRIASVDRMANLSADSFAEFDMEIKFPAAHFDALSRADWTKLDLDDARKAEHGSPSAQADHVAAAKLVPDAYKFAGPVSLSGHFHLEKA